MIYKITDEGFVLHRFPYRETSMIVECFLEHHGRMSFVAKGVRTERSSLKGWLQPFVPLHFNAQGKSQLKTLTQLEPLGIAFNLQGTSLLCAWYINELLLRLTFKEEALPHLYFMYKATLLALETAKKETHPSETEKALRIFEKNLLHALGYQLPLGHDVNGRAIVYDRYYQFIPEHGFVESFQKTKGDVFLGEDLQAVDRDQWSSPKVLQAAKRLMRLAFFPLLGNKPLKTRALFEKMSY